MDQSTNGVKGNNYIKYIILIIAIIIIGGIVVFAGNSNLFKSPTDQLKDKISAIYEANTMSAEMKVAIKSASESKSNMLGNFEGNINFDMKMDNTDKSNPKVAGIIDLKSMGYTANMNFAFSDKTIYFKVNDIPQIIPSVNLFKDIWFNMSKKDIEQALALSGQATSTLDNTLFGDNYNYQENMKLSKKILDDLGIFDNLKYIGTTVIDEKSVKTFTFEISKEKIVDMYIKILNENPSILGSMPNMSGTKEENDKQIRKLMTESFKYISIKPITIYMNAGDDSIGLKVNIELNLPNKYSKDDIDNESKINLDIDIIYKDINKPVTIEIPKDSKSIFDLINSSLTSARNKGRDASIKANLSSLRASAELYYDKAGSYSGFCEKDNNYKLRQADVNKSGSTIQCKVNANSYSLHAKLVDGKYFCVDSTGRVTSLDKIPSGTICK